jgi:hypothetical protein
MYSAKKLFVSVSLYSFYEFFKSKNKNQATFREAAYRILG